MRVLVVDEESKKNIQAVLVRARENPVTENQIREVMAGKRLPIGDDPDYVVHLHDGFRVVYSEEFQPIGLCRHISISVDSDKMPHPAACGMILQEFGFKIPADYRQWEKHAGEFQTWIEEKHSVNFLEKV